MISTSLGAPIARGRTAEVYAWKDGQVLKLFHAWFPPSAVEDECRIARVVSDAGLPVPAVGGIVQVGGRLGLAYERVRGASMLDSLPSRPWTLRRSAGRLAELQVDMHRREAVLDLPSQISRLKEKIRAAEALDPGLREKVLEVLREMPRGSQLCHGDFHPGNVLVTEAGPVVIDWMDATRGNPLSDVARSSLLMSKAPLAGSTASRWLGKLVRYRYHKVYLQRCFGLSPGKRAEFQAWLVVNAAARLNERVPEEQALLAFLREELGR
jgi:Ser/Thr protein kinase RdoA (MazF antagonist)